VQIFYKAALYIRAATINLIHQKYELIMYSWSFQDHTTFIIFMAKVWMISSKQFGWWRLLLYICLIFYSMWILHHFHKFTLLDEALLVCSVAVTTLIYLLRDDLNGSGFEAYSFSYSFCSLSSASKIFSIYYLV